MDDERERKRQELVASTQQELTEWAGRYLDASRLAKMGSAAAEARAWDIWAEGLALNEKLRLLVPGGAADFAPAADREDRP